MAVVTWLKIDVVDVEITKKYLHNEFPSFNICFSILSNFIIKKTDSGWTKMK